MSLRCCRSALVALALWAVASRANAQAVADDPRRPPPLSAPPECELYRGSARGNDPTQLVELVLCVDGANVHGTFQTSSLNSGWSKRSFVGNVIEPRARLALRETAFVSQRSNPGWRFCLIDRYDLRWTNERHIESDYHSTACDDDGHISVDLVAAIDAGVASATGQTLLREQPRVIVAPADMRSVHTRPRSLRERLSCAVGVVRDGRRAESGAALTLVALGLVTVRMRRASRARKR